MMSREKLRSRTGVVGCLVACCVALSAAVATPLSWGSLGLPDDRGYEMVSPLANADGNVFEPTLVNGAENGDRGDGSNTEMPFQAAAAGDAVTYVGDPSATGGTGLEGTGKGNQYLARRGSDGAWTAANIDPTSSYIFEKPVFQAFSEDLSTGILNDDPRSPLVAGAPGEGLDVLYARDDQSGSLRSLLTNAPPNQPAGFPGSEDGEQFDAYHIAHDGIEPELAFAGASADWDHLLFEANDALTPDALDGGPTENNLYDSIDGQLHLVNVLPDGSAQPDAIFGSPWPEQEFDYNPPAFDHAISESGDRVFWSSLDAEERAQALYVRENDAQPQSPLDAQGRCTVPGDACTVQIDASQGGSSTGGEGRFLGASSDGSRVFFTDCQRLTPDATAVPSSNCIEKEPFSPRNPIAGEDLYEYDLTDGHLTDLTVDGDPADALGADVQGLLGLSADGSYVYFAACGKLAAGATSQSCSESNAHGRNLYVIHRGEPPRFIAKLSGEDSRTGSGGGSGEFGDWEPGLGHRTAEVTSDGLHLAFTSHESLTGQATDETSQVYVYDASNGRLTCASCNPDGVTEHTAMVPVSFSNTRLQRWMSATGTRVFFDTREALVPQDSNGQLDVYEWEQDEAGSCTQVGGCIYLLSGGTSSDGSFFADASSDGDDVFIITRAQLVAQDENENFDLYDARVDAPQPVSPPVCSGSGCQGVPPAPPIFATPPSATYEGVGNFPPPAKPVVKPKSKAKPKQCRKGYVRKGGKCKKRKAAVKRKQPTGKRASVRQSNGKGRK
jgi:hypothetical protein